MTAYVSLTALKDRLEIASTDTADDRKLKRDIEAATRTIDSLTQQRFQPYTATRYLTTPYTDVAYVPAGLLSVTTLKTLTANSNGTRTYGDVWSATDYDLTPDDAAYLHEPYNAVRVNPGGLYAFPTDRLGVELAGLWGWWLDTEASGTLGAAIATTTATSVTMTAGHTVEALNTLLIGSEQVYVTAVSTNTLTVQRGVNGTTAATHLINAAVSAYLYPDDVAEACALQASRLFRRHEAPFGVTGAPEVGQTAVIARIDPDVKIMLRDYRRMAASVV